MNLGISHYHNEFPVAPQVGRSYAYEISRARLDLDLCKRRSQLGGVSKRRKNARDFLERKTSRDIPGYTWTMGYNACVGRCSPGIDYPRFSGSSLNRSYRQHENRATIQGATTHFITVAAKAAAKIARLLAGPGWEAFYNFIVRGYPEDQARYRDWVSSLAGSKIVGMLDGLGLSIHVLSTRSRGKIKDKATAFYRACPGSRVFATLTFIAPVDDRTGVTILNKFLTVVRKDFPSLQYFWVAERQENGNIHFHAILNRRLPVQKYNALWVLQQYNAGLRGQNKYGELISKAEILQRYESGKIGKVLNPLTLKKVGSIGGLSMYLTKYITKQEKNVPFNCSVWHCSRGVSRLFIRTTVSPSAFRYCMSLANCRVDKKTGECFMPERFPRPEEGNPFYMGVMINNKSAPLPYLKELEQCNKWMLGGLLPSAIPMCNDQDYSKYFLCQN